MLTNRTPHALVAGRRIRRAVLPALLLALPALVSAAAQTPTKGCPRFARVPGYGACTNTGGKSCGFCTYRCNDDTVVRWNVCAG